MIIWIFAISFVLCVTMIVLRVVELERRRVFAVTRFLNSINFTVEDKLMKLKIQMGIFRQEALFFVTHHLPFHLFNHAHKMTRGLREKYTHIERAVKGRQAIKQNGQASAFIKNIAEHKSSLSSSSKQSDLNQ